MGTETFIEASIINISDSTIVKLNNPLMGTETKDTGVAPSFFNS